MSPRSIEVTWDPPVANVDDVTGYFISYDGVESFADDGSKTIDRLTTSTTINGLEEFVSYDITVQAVYNTINVLSSSISMMTWSAGKYNHWFGTFHFLLLYHTVEVFKMGAWHFLIASILM